MKKMLATVTFAMFTLAPVFAQAQPAPNPNPGTTAGQKLGKRQGKILGPQDGSGPIHTPGTGGGTGRGQRGPRR